MRTQTYDVPLHLWRAMAGWRPLLLLAAALALWAGSAAAQTPPPGGMEFQALGLSPDQMRRVRQLSREFAERMRALQAQLRQQRQALEAVYADYTLDDTKAKRLNDQINDTQRAILANHMRLQVELRKILTEDQFNRLQANIAQRRENMRQRGKPAPPS